MTALDRQDRRSVRLRDYDYSGAGAYFVTICTQGKRCFLSRIDDGATIPAHAGRVVQSIWDSLPDRFPGLELDAFILMPNHVHGVIVLPDRADNAPLGDVVRTFKAASTRSARVSGLPDFGWQRSYYEHVIRDEAELDRVRDYIVGNAGTWDIDRENAPPVTGARSTR